MSNKYTFEIDCTYEQTIRVSVLADNIDNALEKLENEEWDESDILYSKLIIENIDKQKEVEING